LERKYLPNLILKRVLLKGSTLFNLESMNRGGMA